jgi:hypothetical protein
LSDPIDVWCWNVSAAVNADVRVAQVVGHNQQDIRSLCLTVPHLVNDTGDGQKDGGRGERPHGCFHVPSSVVSKSTLRFRDHHIAIPRIHNG